MRKIILAILSLLFMVVLAACGNNGGEQASATPAPADAGATPTPAAEAPADPTNETAPGGQRYGGVLRFVSHLSVSSPGYTPELTGNAALPFITLAYESLLTFDASGNFVPLLATDWVVDASEPSITWTLRQGVYFSDGEPFNAEAVRTNILEYQNFGRGEVANVADFEIIDNYTIKMILGQWDSSMLESIGFFVFYMSPLALQDTDSLRQTSAGTGPFQVVEFNPGVRVLYERNENHWREGRPFLDGVAMYTIEEPTTRAFAFEAGEFDMVFMNNLVVGQQLIDSGLYVLHENQSGVGLVGVGLIPNSAMPGSPFADVRVRQAMSYALNEHALAQMFGRGLLTTTNQWAAPGAITFNPNVSGFPYNPDRSRELMAEAGFADGFDTNIYTVVGNVDLITAAAHMLTEVGIRAQIVQIDDPTQTSHMGTGGWEGIMMHFHALSPNLGLYMGRHLDGAFYVNGLDIPDEVMDLLQRIRTAPTEDERVVLEHQMQTLIYDELALFGQPVFISREPVLSYPHVRDSNFGTYHLFTWTPHEMWLDRD